MTKSNNRGLKETLKLALHIMIARQGWYWVTTTTNHHKPVKWVKSRFEDRLGPIPFDNILRVKGPIRFDTLKQVDAYIDTRVELSTRKHAMIMDRYSQYDPSSFTNKNSFRGE